uniref:Secreted protein n=1 Tax=Sinocyclocheilus rhinocerous TaxID=307959 RepID=A0A673GSH0_9TELE
MIQSSQPISLKLTCNCLRLHLCLGLLGGFFPRGSGARRIRRWVKRYSPRFFVRPNTTKKAFSLFCLPARPRPSNRKSSRLISRVCSRTGMCLPEAQEYSLKATMPSVNVALRKSMCFFRRMRSSAPNRPSCSIELMLKRYC